MHTVAVLAIGACLLWLYFLWRTYYGDTYDGDTYHGDAYYGDTHYGSAYASMQSLLLTHNGRAYVVNTFYARTGKGHHGCTYYGRRGRRRPSVLTVAMPSSSHQHRGGEGGRGTHVLDRRCCRAGPEGGAEVGAAAGANGYTSICSCISVCL